MSGSDDLSVRSHKLLGNFQVLALHLVKSQTRGTEEVEACLLETAVWKWAREEQFVTSPEQSNHSGLLLLTNTAQEMALLFKKTFSPPLIFFITPDDLIS